jgi:4-hydroxy-3-polyprenylbenzoate decarboxylase
MPWEGVFHNITVVSIAKEYPGHARRVMSAVWGQGQMSFCKAVVLVDSSVDLKQPKQILETILSEVDLDSDVYLSEGILDVLDHSAPEALFGGKLGIDATHRIPGERERPASRPSMPLPSREQLGQMAAEVSPLLIGIHAPDLPVRNRILLINFRKDGTESGRTLAEPLLNHLGFKAFSILVLYDESIDLKDGSLVLWKVFNNVDPKRDLIRMDGRIVIDATKKGPEDGHLREWPDDIVMDPDIVTRVRQRASELGIDFV